MKYLGHKGTINIKEFDGTVLLIVSALTRMSPRIYAHLLRQTSNFFICKCHNHSRGVEQCGTRCKGCTVELLVIIDVEAQGQMGFRFIGIASGLSKKH